MNQLRDYFDRVVAINLDRRRDRWDAFCKDIASVGWPFRLPQRQSAVDGEAVGAPPWWKQSAGAWGCMMSHARIIEDCLREGVERVLILEDDAILVEGFAERVERFLDRVPDDWDQLYLGGQHLKNPRRINELVYECVNVNRTHCHAMSRKFMSRFYRHILNAQDYMTNPGHHIDHRLGALQETRTVKVFAPIAWLAGQREDKSDISGRTNATYFWNSWAAVPEMIMFVVLAPHEGHANEVGGLLRSIGVHFGHNLGGYRPPVVEDSGLSDICERVFPFPSTTRRLPVKIAAPLLHNWARVILQEAADYGTVGAASYPHLCAMYDDMALAWRRLKVINVVAEIDASIGALISRSEEATGSFRLDGERARDVQMFLDGRRQDWLAHCECLNVDPTRIETDSQRLVAELREFMGLSLPSRAR
jgi:hypothetical protein